MTLMRNYDGFRGDMRALPGSTRFVMLPAETLFVCRHSARPVRCHGRRCHERVEAARGDRDSPFLSCFVDGSPLREQPILPIANAG